MEMETEESPPTTVDPSCPPFPHLQPKQENISGDLPVLELPTLDLEEEGFDRAALVAACRELGAFRLVNHGVSADLSGRLFGLAQELLSRVPFERKKTQPGYFWGTPALSLRVKDVNWVEGFHFQHQSDAPDHADDTATATAAAAAFSLLRTLTAEYCSHMACIARRLFDALAAELGLDAHQTASYLDEHHGTFRVYRYPPSGGSHQLGMEPHTDSSVLSILNQDLVGGLQLLHKDEDAWYNVVPVRGTLLVNLGDMMQAISGDAYRSVRHRVVASPATERLSLCYFAFPQDDAVLCPSRCDRYRPFSYREFREQVQADIKATGSKVGLQRFLAVNYNSS